MFRMKFYSSSVGVSDIKQSVENHDIFCEIRDLFSFGHYLTFYTQEAFDWAKHSNAVFPFEDCNVLAP